MKKKNGKKIGDIFFAEYAEHDDAENDLGISVSDFELAKFRLKKRPDGFTTAEEFYPLSRGDGGANSPAGNGRPAKLQIAVDEIGQEYFVIASVSPPTRPHEHAVALSSCRSRAAFVSFPSLLSASQGERSGSGDDKFIALLIKELVQTLSELGVRHIVVDVSSISLLEVLARILGREHLGRPYGELQADIEKKHYAELRLAV